MVSNAIRRLVDVAVALTVLICGLPILAVIAVLIRLTMGFPIFFTQERAGRSQKPFRLMKFRTMREPAPGKEAPEFEGERITSLGAFLRMTSLDELPGFWNLLKGDLTLVGPRPLPMSYLSRYHAHELSRFEVKPGFTGLAQVNGRNLIEWDQRLQLDADYVATRSLKLDIQILVRTVPLVLGRRGVSAADMATMSELPQNRRRVN